MEIAPPSSFSQVSALFNDTSEQQRIRELAGLYPIETPNIHYHSSDFQQASSHTGLDVEFRTADTHEGHRLLNGPLLYPFQSTAQIFNHKFDPFYYDGSELDTSFNVQENLIGTPLGATNLEDPRMSYVKNMLQMKELHGANHPLDDTYLKELFMVNTEKGSNYYQAQLDKLDASMSNYSRMGRYSKQKPLHDIQFSQNIATGAPIHEKHTARIEYQSPTDAGPIQHSRRAQRMQRVDDMTAPYHIVPTNMSYRTLARGRGLNTSQEGSDLQSETRSTLPFSHISLPDGDINWEDEISTQLTNSVDEQYSDRGLTIPSLGGPNTNVTPSARSHRSQQEQSQYPGGAEPSAPPQLDGSDRSPDWMRDPELRAAIYDTAMATGRFPPQMMDNWDDTTQTNTSIIAQSEAALSGSVSVTQQSISSIRANSSLSTNFTEREERGRNLFTTPNARSAQPKFTSTPIAQTPLEEKSTQIDRYYGGSEEMKTGARTEDVIHRPGRRNIPITPQNLRDARDMLKTPSSEVDYGSELNKSRTRVNDRIRDAERIMAGELIERASFIDRASFTSRGMPENHWRFLGSQRDIIGTVPISGISDATYDNPQLQERWASLLQRPATARR